MNKKHLSFFFVLSFIILGFPTSKDEFIPAGNLSDIIGNFGIIYNYQNDYPKRTSSTSHKFFHQYQVAISGLKSLEPKQRLFVYTFLINMCNVDLYKEKDIWEIIKTKKDAHNLLAKLNKRHKTGHKSKVPNINNLEKLVNLETKAHSN